MSMDYNQLMQQLQQMRQQGGGQPGSVIPLPGQSGNGMPSLAQLLQQSGGRLSQPEIQNMIPPNGMSTSLPQIPPPTNAGMNTGAYPNQIDKQMQMSPGYMDFMNNAYDNMIKQIKNSPNAFQDPLNPIPAGFRNY